MTKKNATSSNPPSKWHGYIVTYGLWLVTSVLAVLEIVILRDLALAVYIRLFPVETPGTVGLDYWRAASLGQWTIFVWAIVAIAVIIGGFEYHRKRPGQVNSYKVLAWTLSLQMGLLLLYFLFV